MSNGNGTESGSSVPGTTGVSDDTNISPEPSIPATTTPDAPTDSQPTVLPASDFSPSAFPNPFPDLSLSLDSVADVPNADAANLFPDLSLSLNSDIGPIPLVVDPLLSVGILDSPAASDFSPSAFPNPFPDLSLNLNVENFNPDSAKLLGEAIMNGLPLSLNPVAPGTNWFASGVNTVAGAYANWFMGVIDVTGMFAQWLAGTAPALSVYGPQAQQTQDMMTAPGVSNALAFFYAKNAGLSLDQQQPVLDYNPTFGLPGLLAAGVNPTQQFVGDYRLDLYPQADGTILIVATNPTSMTSLLYGWWPNAWNPPSGSTMGTATQIYYWTVPNQSVVVPAAGGY